jgi:hypothetical protein
VSSLTTCIKKAGKALDARDQETLRSIHDDLVAAGDPDPANNAITEYVRLIKAEQKLLASEIAERGGKVDTQPMFRIGRDQETAAEISSTPLLDGTEELKIEGKPTTVTLADALVKRTRAANRGRKLDGRTNRTKEILSEALALETEAAIGRSGHAGDWYSNVLEKAVSIVSEIHPELKTDGDAKSMFLLGLAITSNGMDVSANARYAEEVYRGYKKSGVFPTKGYGDKGPAMTSAFESANALIDRWGLDGFARFLNTEFTVSELKQLGFDISGENVDFKTHGSVIFGPKIGGGFYQNLVGNFSPLTMDRWFMRTWGRLTGTLLPDTSVMPEGQAARLTDAIQADRATVEALGYNVEEVLADDKKLLLLAKDLHRAYAKSGFKDKTNLNKAGKNLDLSMNAPVIAPRSGSERAWIREVAELAINKLTQRGVNVNAASMQALVWYPEKDLYMQHGVGNAKSTPTDYEQEFAKLAAEYGVDQQRIASIRAGEQEQRPAGPARDVGRDGEAGVEGGAAPRLEPKARQRLLHKSVTQRLREQLPVSHRGSIPKRNEQRVKGAPVAQVFKPEVRVKNGYNAVGLATPTMYELQQTPEGAKAFTKAIQAAKKASPAGAAVYVYPQEDYENMRTFLSEDGMSGVALNGDDIVSVFKHPKSPDAGVVQGLISLAVSEGGRRLDAFDTALPTMYSMQGFKVVSRLKWDETQAPDGWSKKDFDAFNHGEPDVVFMVYDKNHTAGYTGAFEGQMVEDYGQAVDIQQQAVEDLNERNKPESVLFSLPNEDAARINRDPESPLSQLHKLGATVEDQANLGTAHPLANALREAVDVGAVKAILAAVPRRYLRDYLPKEKAPSVDRYLRQANRMDGRRNELMATYEETSRKWATWTRKNKRTSGVLSDLMHSATLAGVDPQKKYRPLKKPQNMSEADKRLDAIRREQHTLMKDVFDNRLDKTAREIYAEVRDSYLGMRRGVENALMERIKASDASTSSKRKLMDELRLKFEAGRVAGPYFPLMRYGNRWAVARDKKVAKGKKTGEIISFSRFENRRDQLAWVKEFRDAGYQVSQGQRSEEDQQMANDLDPNFVTKVVGLAKETGDSALVDEIWQAYLSSLPEMSIRKRFQHRKGRLGFAADGLRSYATVSFRNAHQQAKLEYMHKMQGTLNDLSGEVRAIEDDPSLEREFKWAMPVYDEMVRRHAAAQNPSASPLSVKATGMGFLWYLGATPAAAAVNLSQTALVGLPVLAAEYNAAGASVELARALKQYGGARANLENSLRGAELDAFKEAKRIGLFEKTQAHDLAGITEAGSAGNYGGVSHRAMEIGSWMFHKAEELNRQVTFLAAYRLGIEAGRSQADAVMKAEDLVWDAHFDYNNDNRPVWMQSNAGRVITLFKQYSLNMSYRLARDFRDGVMRNPDLSVEERNKARTRFVGMNMMAFVLSGLSGLPTLMALPFKLAAEAIFDDEDDPFDADDAFRAYLTELAGPVWAEAIMKGPVDTMSGATVSNRVALSNLWWRESSAGASTEQMQFNFMKEMMGPIVSLGLDAFAVSHEALGGDVTYAERGVEKLMPKVARDLFRVYRYQQEGALTQHVPQDVVMAKDDFSAMDLVWQGVGFTPARLTMQYEQNAALRTKEAGILDQRARRQDAFNLARFNNDKKGMAEAMEGIHLFNKKQPTVQITNDSLNASGMNRMRRNILNRGGVNLNPKLHHLYKELRFTPLPEEGEND